MGNTAPKVCPSLIFEGIDEDSNDYRLEGCSVWISVDELSVYVRRTEGGVAVDIYARKNEADDPALSSCEADFTDAFSPTEYSTGE